MEMNRDDARKAFSDSGLTYAVISKQSIQLLRNLINQRMKESGYMKDSYRCWQRGKIRLTQWGVFAEIRCRSENWESREAVSFNTDGFIGFAGWADNKNIQPVLAGFMDWLKEMTPKAEK